MVSEYLKGKAATTGGRTSHPPLKPPLKQKTLLDSFFTKNAPKVIPIEDEPAILVIEDVAEELTTPNSIPLVNDIPAALPECELNNGPTPIDIMDDSDSLPPSLGSSVVELTDVAAIPEPTTEKAFVEFQNNLPNRERSPSIMIMDDPMGVVSTVPSKSNKFERPLSRSTSKEEGKTPDQPILVGSSPIKGPSTSMRPNKPIHPFFGAKQKAAATTTPFVPPVLQTAPKLSEGQAPPFPDRFCQHIRGAQTTTQQIPLTTFSKRTSYPSQILDQPSDYQFLKGGKPIVGEPAQAQTRTLSTFSGEDSPYSPLNIPRQHQANHPAIARLIHDNPRGPLVSRRPWTEKWRPSCAPEVLGNEMSAIYLRNWLRALELQLEGPTTVPPTNPENTDTSKGKGKAVERGKKRARVVRTVEKKRKKSRMDSDEEEDWIVRTDEETDEEISSQEIDEFSELLSEPPISSPSPSVHDNLPNTSPPSQKPEKEPDLGQLHNTILLVGPHGSGKTASVYACAEELGWEVFEVYPGIGRRNGANVDNIIGEVGKNHLVLQNRQSEDILKSFVQPKSKLTAQEPLTGSDYSPRKKSTQRATSELGDLGIVEAKPIRQSLILLEEVDILFKEDTNFWSTVTRIIKECKRPVVCTCNDISLIPVNDLPLQNILQFNPCQSDVAVSYLQALCYGEGFAVKSDLLGRLYTDSVHDQALLNPFLASTPRTPDLRRTINALQVLCATNRSESPGPLSDCPPTMSANIDGANASGGGTSSLRQCVQGTSRPRIPVKESEFLSSLDCALHLNSLHNFAAAEFAGYLASDDDEIGHIILHDQYVQDATQYGLNDRHGDILTSTVQLSRGVFDVDVEGDALATETLEENTRKAGYEQRIALQEVCPMGVWTRRDASSTLDYIPMIRQIVEAEDMQEAREMEKRSKGGRNTRNSARSGYVRILELTEAGRRVLVRTGL